MKKLPNDLKSNSPCKILFLEDEEQDMELMKHELDKAGFKHLSKRVSSKKDFLDALQTFIPHVILADYHLPMFNGMHAFRLFKERQLCIPFILVTGALSEELILEYQAEGIHDFVLKSSFRRLPSVIQRNLEISQAEIEKDLVARELAEKKEELKVLRSNAEKARAYEMLSKREYEIFCLIAAGKSIKEIADELSLSPSSVATYRQRMLEKMDLKSNVEISLYAMRHKLIE